MFLKKYEALPDQLQNEKVKYYYDVIAAKKATCFFKTVFDYLLALILFIILLPFLLIIGILVKCTSKGPVFFYQVRVGRYLKPFKIIKFRTMVVGAEKMGAQITVGEKDPRITGIGAFLRRFRLDELPQVINVLKGDMSFVGTRPEVPKYVKRYQPEMLATLLLKPGITGLASIAFKDENAMLGEEDSPEAAYVNKILPVKMKINLEYIEKMSVLEDIKIMFKTLCCDH